MQHGKPGFRILEAPSRLDAALVARFRGLAAANVADAMGRFNAMDARIRARTGRPLSGVAVTVQCRPADNLMVHKAIELAQPGDIVVVSTCGNADNAVFGGLMCHTAAAKKLGGIVVDGAIRDIGDLDRLEFPAFSAYVAAGSCDKDGPGEVNIPIACGGVVVCPGDIVVGDEDGVAVVPRAQAEAVLEGVAALVTREKKRIVEIAGGVLYKPDVDDTLRKHGVI